jgi:hypothetical protein
MQYLSFVAYISAVLFLPLAKTQSLTISQVPGYTVARDCVRWCLGGDLWLDTLAGAIGCPNSSSCLCKDYMSSSATSYLSSCIYKYFSTCVSQDYTSAVRIYEGYCRVVVPLFCVFLAYLLNVQQKKKQQRRLDGSRHFAISKWE